MTKGQRAGETPIGVDVVEGKSITGAHAAKVQNNLSVMVHTKIRLLNLYLTKQNSLKKFFSVLANKQMINQYAMDHIIQNKV